MVQRRRDKQAAKKAFLKQLVGKKIVYPEGSVFEQAFRAFCQDTEFAAGSLPVINAAPSAVLLPKSHISLMRGYSVSRK